MQEFGDLAWDDGYRFMFDFTYDINSIMNIRKKYKKVCKKK